MPCVIDSYVNVKSLNSIGDVMACHVSLRVSATEPKWRPRFQDLKISVGFLDFSEISGSHRDLKILIDHRNLM